MSTRVGGKVIGFVAVNINFCPKPGCKPVNPIDFVESNAPRTTIAPGSYRVRLPAGLYTLRVVADGGPVHTILHLPALTGTRSINPDGPADATVLDLTRTLPADSVYSGGATSALPSEGGSILTDLVVDRTASLGRDGGMCIYQDSAPPAGLYLPECPGAFFGANLLIPEANPLPSEITEYGGVLGLPPGRWNLGEYEETAGPTDVTVANALWIGF